MGENDRLPDLRDPLLGLVLLTRLPAPRLSGFERAGVAAWSWPLVGLLLGGVAGAVSLAVSGLGPFLAAVLAVLALVLMTGALHEDGLADVADGFWGGFERARRLEIMKDSRIGAYGVLALVFGFALRVGALAELGALMALGLMSAAMLSRAVMAAVMAALPNARGEGLSAQTGRPPAMAALLAGLLAFAGTLALTGFGAALAALLAAAVAGFGCAALARAKIGGQTGDVLGASQQVSEVAVLLALCLAL